MHSFPRPQTPTVAAQREAVAALCPQCGSAQIAAYRVLSEGGWWQVIKCQDCLHSLRRDRGPLLGSLTPLASGL